MPLTNHRPFFVVAMVAATAGVATLIIIAIRKRRAKRTDQQGASFAEVLKRQEVVVIEKIEDAKPILIRLISDTKKQRVLGMDCEWTTDRRSKKANQVALLQLASPNGLCALFRLCKVPSLIELPELSQLLNDRSILKVGVGILADAKKIGQDYGLSTKGCVDLRHLALRHLSRGHQVKGGSLSELSRVCLNYELDKSWTLRCSDWESQDLTAEQTEYAAVDACVAVAIFYKLVMSKLPQIIHSEEDWWSVSALCQGLVDAKFKVSFISHVDGGKKNSTNRRTEKETQTLEKLREKPLSKIYVARKEPLYDNCKLISPNGTLLCTCDRAKAEWYLSKDIAEVVSEDPLTVRLKFEPAGIPGPDREYYLQEKSNMCVVCGRTDSYIRKNIVPHEYRRHFPDYLKKHSSHDVLLLCIQCHQCSWNYDSALRESLAKEYDAPINAATNTPTREDAAKVRVRSAAKALLRHEVKKNLPVQRRYELENVIKQHFNVSVIDLELLSSASKMSTRVKNEVFEMSHGEKVVKAISQTSDGFANFEKRWRVHFLNRMQPKFMPNLWSVDHKHESQTALREMRESKD